MNLPKVRDLVGAVRTGNFELAAKILKHQSALACEWQPLMDACNLGNPKMVGLLLDHGADPNVVSRSAFRYRPLHRTVEHKVMIPRGEGHREVVGLLLAAGADVMARATMFQQTAIAVAALGGESHFLPLLTPHAPKQHDIFLSCVLLETKRVAALLKKDPRLATAPDENGWTPLAYCARTRVGDRGSELARASLEIGRLLLAHGADPDSGLAHAINSGKEDLTVLLLERGATLDDGDTLVHLAEAGRFEILDTLADRGVDLQSTSGTEHHGGYTPMGCLVTLRSLRGVRWFLERGIDPNYVAGGRGETALHVAVRSKCKQEMIDLLVRHGVNTAARDTEGKTADEVA